jgi:hypothetical protein
LGRSCLEKLEKFNLHLTNMKEIVEPLQQTWRKGINLPAEVLEQAWWEVW